MEESSTQMSCNLENDEDEDLAFFQRSIKVHNRFGDNCDEEDEFFSDDEPDEPITCQKGGYLKPVGGFGLSSEAKLETISMLDNVRSSCSRSGHDLSLEMLNLKSDEAGLGNLEGVFLGKSILSSGPPFGDPLSEMDILDSALSLLDDKTCQKFREKGLFDGLVVDKRALSDESEWKAENVDEAKLDLVTSNDRQTPEPYYNICNSPENLAKPSCESTHEDVSKPDVRPTVKSEPLAPLPSRLIKKPRQSQSSSSSRKGLNDSDSLDSKGSIGREFPPNNLSLDDLVRYINGESLKKVCRSKTITPSAELPLSTTANTKRSKKQPVKKHEVATTSKARVPPPANRPRKFTKKPSQPGAAGTEEFAKEGSPQDVFCDVAVMTTSSAVTTSVTASSKEAASASDAENEDETVDQDEFVAVLHKRRVKTRKESHPSQDTHSACMASPRAKVAVRQPERASARVDKDLGASTMSVFSVSSKSYRSDTSGGSMTSKRGSLSSLDESPPLATYETSTFGAFTGSQEYAGVPYSRSSFSKFSAGNSYASALLQNMPKLSVTGSREASATDPGAVEGATFSSPLNSEAESEMLLSPPQSEADTGFSSSSSLSPDEAHNSLASDSAVTMLRINPVVDSEPRIHPLGEASMLKHTAADLHHENLEECVVQASISSHLSNLDLPLARISELSRRTDETQHVAGESNIACGSQDLSCATTQSKTSPVIFDTRIRTVAHKMSSSDIVFLFDAEDSGADDTASNVGNYVPVDDIEGVTFTDSPDSMSLDSIALETSHTHYTVLDVGASYDTKTSDESCSSELTDKPDVEHQCGIQDADDLTRRDERVSARDLEHENPVDNRKSVGEVVCLAPGRRFDLYAAQKFFSQAFKSVLKRESECLDSSYI